MALLSAFLIITAVLGAVAGVGWLQERGAVKTVRLQAADYPPGTVTFVDLHRFPVSRQAHGIYMVNENGVYTAFYARSTWGNCSLLWEPDKATFRDCHGLLWDRQGNPSGSGPRRASMDRFPIERQGDSLVIQIARPLPRPGEFTRPF